MFLLLWSTVRVQDSFLRLSLGRRSWKEGPGVLLKMLCVESFCFFESEEVRHIGNLSLALGTQIQDILAPTSRTSHLLYVHQRAVHLFLHLLLKPHHNCSSSHFPLPGAMPPASKGLCADTEHTEHSSEVYHPVPEHWNDRAKLSISQRAMHCAEWLCPPQAWAPTLLVHLAHQHPSWCPSWSVASSLGEQSSSWQNRLCSGGKNT